MDQVQEELEAARFALVSLLAVVTEEQFTAVERALEALAGVSDIAPVALAELQVLRGRRQAPREQEETNDDPLAKRVAMPDKPG